MPISVFLRTSNPHLDLPDFNVPREQADFLLSCGRARRLVNAKGKTSTRRIQLTVEHRLEHAIVRDFANAALIEGFTVWRVVHQTARDGIGPGMPNWQMRT